MDKNYRFCIACGASTESALHSEDKIKCHYCGYELLKFSPIENVHNRIKIKLLHKHDSSQIKVMAILLCISLFIVIGLLSYANWNLFNLKTDFVFWIAAILMLGTIGGLLKNLKGKRMSGKFLQKCNYDINRMRAELTKDSSNINDNIIKLISKYEDIIEGKRSMAALLDND